MKNKKKINLIWSHCAETNLVAYLVSKLIRCKLICQIHGPEKLEKDINHKTILKKILYNLLFKIDRYILKKAYRIIVVEKELVKWIEKELSINKKNIEIIENYPDLSLFKYKEHYKNSRDKFIVGYLGTLEKGRANPVLELSEQLQNIDVFIIGDGPDKYHIIRNYPKIKIITEKNYERIPSLISQLNLGVVPPLNLRKKISFKGPPMKLFEYLACGVPVLLIDLWDYKEFIDKNHLGVVVSKNNVKEGVLQVKKNYSLFIKEIKKFRKIMEKKYSWGKESKKLINIIKSQQKEH